MGDRTGIEWTDTTWNPVTGCSKVSRGCDHCYAETIAHRRLRHIYMARTPVVDTAEQRTNPFAVRLWPDRLDQPFCWTQPKMVFVNSMSDLFHKDVPYEYAAEIFEVMLTVDHHIYQVLTKRPARAERFWNNYRRLVGLRDVPEHIWIGTSIEDQRHVYRARHLQRISCRIRFLSCEPLLGPLAVDLTGIHWVIVGGESGLEHRPMKPEWARAIKERCIAAGVPFFFKQVGGRTSKAGGRNLDGREWNEMPLHRMLQFREQLTLAS